MTQLQDKEAQDGREPQKPDEPRRDAFQSLRGSAGRTARLRRLPGLCRTNSAVLSPQLWGCSYGPPALT